MYIKKIFFTVLFCGLAFCQSFAATKPVLNIQTWQTTNGTPVYFVASPEIPMVQINVVFAAGSARDGDKPGLAQLTNAVLNEGTADLNADQIAQKFDAVGAIFGNGVDRDKATVALQSLTDPQYLTPALQTFTDVLTKPNFPQDAFLRNQKQLLNIITQQQQTPNAVAKNAFYAATYGNQPYAHPPIGTMLTVSALTANDLINFYKQYYVAKNAIITIVGAVDRNQAEKMANQLSAGLATGTAAVPLATAPMLTQANMQRIKFPSEQTNIIAGQVGINFNNPDYFPLTVGNYLLGGSGLTSLLFNQVREKRGLAYGVGSGFTPLEANGPFGIILQTRNSEANKALQVAQDTLKDFMKSGPSPAELSATKEKIINSFPLGLVGNDAISDNLVTIAFYHLPLNYLDTYRDKVNAVTVDQIKNAFQKTVSPDKFVTIMVGNGQ